MHAVYFDKDDNGWDIATCSCGYTTPPTPDIETAAEFWGDHRAEQGRREFADELVRFVDALKKEFDR